MKTRFFTAYIIALVVARGVSILLAQDNRPEPRPVHVPDSSVEQPGDHGLTAHTNHLLYLRSTTPAGVPSGLSPQQIRAAYGNLPASGGSGGIIAIVDAFDYPTALSDFNTFSTQFQLPTESSTDPLASTNAVFQVVYASGHKPRGNCGWNQEAALDIEWAHALSPSAKIVLVEAASNSFSNLFQAIQVANGLTGVQQVSMSWGGSEFSSETLYDQYFSNAGVVYVAASGDTSGQTIYPSVSPKVISAGGTTLVMSGTTLVSETAWGTSGGGTTGSGGGPSLYEPQPGFQNGLVSGTQRGTPDLAFDADPATGVSVYDSTRCQGLVGWLVFGGTSVAAPSLAGIVNLAGNLAGANELTFIYGGYPTWYSSNEFRDITSSGSETTSYPVGTGWDFVTGIGSVIGVSGK
jgi:subtilase family serine protease